MIQKKLDRSNRIIYLQLGILNSLTQFFNHKVAIQILDTYLLFYSVVVHGESKLSHNKVQRYEHELVLEVLEVMKLCDNPVAQHLRLAKVFAQQVVPRLVDLRATFRLNPA